MPTSRQEDTEITLTTSKVLVLFFALSAICAVFFALGFLFGKNSTKQAEAIPASQPAVLAHTDAPKPSAGPANVSSRTTNTPGSPENSATPSSTKSDVPTQSQSVPLPVSDAAQPLANGYYVQVAAVSKQEDADALIDALKNKQYAAFLPESADKLFHVQIGPFADIKDAENIRARLLSDGYNPIIKR